MSATTFDQFQAKIKDAKKRIKENGEQFIQTITTLDPTAAVGLDELVTVDTEELKKLEAELGAKLKEEFTESVGGEESEENLETEASTEVENPD